MFFLGAAVNLQDILADIHTLEEELLQFEKKYGVRCETFYAAYVSGEEPEDENWVLDFGEWASVYKTWLTRQADYRNAIQRDTSTKSSVRRIPWLTQQHLKYWKH